MVRVFEIDGRDAADALGVDIGGNDALAKRQRRQDRQLRARVEAVDVGGGIGFGVAGLLRFGEHLFEARAALLDLRQDVVAGAVQNAVERGDAIAGDAFAQNRVNGDAAGDAGLHRQIDAAAMAWSHNSAPAERHQFLVGGDDGFAPRRCGFDDLARDRGAAHQLRDDLDIGMLHHLPPVRRLQRRPERGGNLFLVAMPRLQTAPTRNGKPSFSAIWSAFSARMSSVPEPTLPRPMTPILTGCINVSGSFYLTTKRNSITSTSASGCTTTPVRSKRWSSCW